MVVCWRAKGTETFIIMEDDPDDDHNELSVLAVLACLKCKELLDQAREDDAGAARQHGRELVREEGNAKARSSRSENFRKMDGRGSARRARRGVCEAAAVGKFDELQAPRILRGEMARPCQEPSGARTRARTLR